MFIILLTCGVVTCVISTVFTANEVLTSRKAITEEMLSLADIVEAKISARDPSHVKSDLRETLSGLSANPRVLTAKILTGGGILLAEYTAPGEKDPLKNIDPAKGPWPDWMKSTLSPNSGPASHVFGSGKDTTILRKISTANQPIGTLILRPKMKGLTEQLGLSFIITTAVLMISFMLAFILSNRLQDLVTVPVMNLVQTMKRVSREKNYSLRSQTAGQDEIGSLIDSFNEMLSEIESREETLRERQEHLQRLAHFDNLTHLPNRSLYCDRLHQSILQAERAKKRIAVMFVDLDHFKDINDSAGHRIGDLLLVEVAGRLQKIIRASDTVARMGGDEFTILLPNVRDKENTGIVADKILKALSEPYRVDGNEFYITASVGITLYPDDGKTVDELLKNADTAMYKAKSDGKNMFQFYSQDMLATVTTRMILLSSLHQALKRDEFVIHYQPKMDTVRNRMIGLEALIRWNHPELGMIVPDRFIPLAEETGLIVPIGEWVIRECCRQISAWKVKGYPSFPISINVSPVQLKRQNFSEVVGQIIEETGVDSSLLDLEVTETAIMQDTGFTTLTLQRFKEMGITICIDDFGTGYSSLSQLKRFPIDTLKIDKSFIVNIEKNADDQSIVLAIISMAHSLGLKVIAEGVETRSQLSLLCEQGCQTMQGFYFSKPLPAANVERLMNEYRARNT